MRHGESDWNQKGLWTGWTDVSLTEKGEEEAKKAASSIKDISFDLFISSDLIRASQTLEIIQKELKDSTTVYWKVAAYKERHYGVYTGKNKWEIQKQMGEAKFQQLRRGWDVPIPEGETLKDVYNRVLPHFKKEVLHRLRNGKNIMIVAHGNTHRAIIKFLEGMKDDQVADIEMATGEVIVYEIDQSGKIKNKEKKLLNNQKGKQ